MMLPLWNLNKLFCFILPFPVHVRVSNLHCFNGDVVNQRLAVTQVLVGTLQ
jgi:hypothetical protein